MALTVTTLRGPPNTHTYNFEVADFHTYFVGSTGVWVHNEAVGTSPVAWCQIVLSGFEELAKNGRPLWNAYDDYATGPLGKRFDVNNWPRWRLRLFNEVRQKHFTDPTGLAPWNDLSKLVRQKIGFSKNSAVLRHNMLVVTGMADPGKQFTPHHIVMTVNNSTPNRNLWSQGCRDVLDRFGIDINDTGNGVMLPNARAKPADFEEKVYGLQHMGEGIHTDIYMQNVWERVTAAAESLSDATPELRAAGATKIRDTLQKIGMELANRSFPVD